MSAMSTVKFSDSSRRGHECKNGCREHMIPGYTGYIPSGNQFFGERFAVLIKRAKEEQKANSKKCSSDVCCRKKWLKFDLANIKSRHFSTPGSNGPLKPIVEKAPMFYGKGVRPSARPCAMRRDNPDKHFISGYTGFVPRARKYMGMQYPAVTNKALRDFYNAMTEFATFRHEPIDIHRKIGGAAETVAIFQPEGMIPRYTGHIQGEQNKFGKGFGETTKEAICKLKGIKQAK